MDLILSILKLYVHSAASSLFYFALFFLISLPWIALVAFVYAFRLKKGSVLVNFLKGCNIVFNGVAYALMQIWAGVIILMCIPLLPFAAAVCIVDKSTKVIDPVVRLVLLFLTDIRENRPSSWTAKPFNVHLAQEWRKK